MNATPQQLLDFMKCQISAATCIETVEHLMECVADDLRAGAAYLADHSDVDALRGICRAKLDGLQGTPRLPVVQDRQPQEATENEHDASFEPEKE